MTKKTTINVSMNDEVGQALRHIHGYLDKAMQQKQESLRLSTASVYYLFNYAMKCKAKEQIEKEGEADVEDTTGETEKTT